MSATADPKATPRSAVDRWNAAVHEARGEGPGRVLAMSNDEIARELSAAGVSPAEADAGAEAFVAALRQREDVVAPPEPAADDGAWARAAEGETTGRPKRTRAAYIAFGIAAAAAVGGAAYVATRPAPEEPRREEPVPSPTATAAPTETIAPALPPPVPTHAAPEGPSDEKKAPGH